MLLYDSILSLKYSKMTDSCMVHNRSGDQKMLLARTLHLHTILENRLLHAFKTYNVDRRAILTQAANWEKKKIRQTRKKKIRPPKTQVKVGVKNILHYQLGDHQLQHSTWQKWNTIKNSWTYSFDIQRLTKWNYQKNKKLTFVWV